MSGSLSARQSRTNQPPGSDAVAVPLALARPTTEWHQHIQNRRSDPHIAAQCVCSIESGPCERVDVFHVSDDWIGYNVSDWFMRDMTTKELIIMADPNRPRHYEEEFKRQIVQS